MGKFDTSLYKFGIPFSSQLVLRNLQGLDLDDEKQTLATARGYAKKMDVPETRIGARIVLAVTVHEGAGEPTLPDINTNVFRPVEDG
jgi:hypothetical protein